MSSFKESGGHTLESVGSGESPQAPRRTFGQKVKSHLKRFWWLHLLWIVLVALIIVLCLIFVGMPKVAQKNINNARLSLESQEVTSPRPGTVHVTMNTTTESRSSRHPQLYSFKAALFLEDTKPDIKPFGYIEIPAAKAESVFSILIDQDMEIVDQEQFARYNGMVLASETYRVGLKGRIPLKEGSLPKTTVDFNHVLESKGLNGLKGLEIRNVSISLAPSADGSNMKAQVFIPNPSPMTIEMGTVMQTVYVGQKAIGISTIPNLTLRPGDNLFNMSAVADQLAVVGLIQSQYPTAKLPVRIVGLNSTVNGQLIPYFTAALRAAELSTTLDLGPALAAAGLNLGGGSGSGSGTSSVASTPAQSAVSTAA
jgi:hypothetical protein